MANKTTKPRFDPQWATGLVLLGALGFSVGVGLRAYQVPENPAMVVSQPAAAQPVKPQPIKLQKITLQPKPQLSQQPRVVRVVRIIRRPVVMTRGS